MPSGKIITSHRLNFQHPFMHLCTIFIFLNYFFIFFSNGSTYLAQGRPRGFRSYLPPPILFPVELAKQSMTCAAGTIGQNHHFTPSKFSIFNDAFKYHLPFFTDNNVSFRLAMIPNGVFLVGQECIDSIQKSGFSKNFLWSQQ